MVKFLTNNPSQTKKFGEFLAKEISKIPPTKKSFILGLEGDLGSGKTTFLQGFAKGLGIKERILSPTFVIMKKFQIPKFGNFYHIDCYRIQKPKEILDLEFKKIISTHGNIVAVEWADRIRKILPGNTLMLKFKLIDRSARKIMVKFKND